MCNGSGGPTNAGQSSEVLTSAMRGAQELRVFLEAEDSLATSFEWAQLQPMHGTILEGVARLPRQLFGEQLVGLQLPVLGTASTGGCTTLPLAGGQGRRGL